MTLTVRVKCRSGYEKKRMDNEKKHAEWESRQQARSCVVDDVDGKSEVSECTVSTASTEARAIDHAEVQRRASTDMEVRKLQRLLREIERLQQLQSLDKLQAAKVSRKSEVEVQLNTARGLAEAHARNELRQEAKSEAFHPFPSAKRQPRSCTVCAEERAGVGEAQ